MNGIHIETNNRVCILGKSGSGKSVLEVYLLKRLQTNVNIHVVVSDLKNDLHLPYALAHNIDELSALFPKNRLIHYVPTSIEPDDFNVVCNFVYNMGNTMLVIDEVSYYTTANTIERWHRELLVRGRSRGVGVIHLSQRPMHVYNAIISETDHLFVFQLLLKGDIDKIRPMISADMCDKVPVLPKYHFIYADTDRHVIMCKPVHM